MRFACGLLILVLLLGAPAARAQTYSESTDVVVVEVPVQVLNGAGEPVRGLTADDFEVYERGRKQKIVGFEVLDLKVDVPGEAKTHKAPPPVSARRHFLFLFDLSFSSPKAAGRSREAARKILEKLHPSDLVAVGSYISTKGAELLLAFSGDRDQALMAIDRIAKPTGLDYAPDPLRLVMGGGAVEYGGGSSESEEGRGSARESVAASIAGAEADFNQGTVMSLERADRIQQERAMTAMTRSLTELARMMQGVRGRKHVVLFSEGFDGSLLRGTANVDEQNEMASSSTAGEYWNIDSEKRYGSTKAASVVEDMLEEFRRADCVIQAVDVGGLREGARPEDQWAGGKDSLFLMAKETGGELYENYNDLDVALTDMLERNSVTYVLAFQPEKIERDGAYHRLKVELKASQRGLRLVHRPGYYSPRPHDQQNPLEQALSAGERILSGFDGGTIHTAVLTAPFRVAGPGAADAYVPVLIEVDGETLLAGDRKGGTLPADIFAYAFDSSGKVRDYFSQNLTLDLAKVGPALRQSGLKFFGHLDLPPGEYSVRVLVRNGAGAWGLKAASVSVPDFAAPVLLPPFFPEQPGQWLIVREAPREGDRTVPYPFLAGVEPYIPSSLPKLAPGKQAAMSLVVYHLQPGELRAEARILTPDGREAGTGEVRIVQRHGPGEDGADRVAATFEPPAGLRPGEYLLLLTVVDARGGAESSAAAFTVPGAS
ncbi:MAG TPA: VWA domain-containing protein [Thermoanaerobaculia bacterium]|jgi:VWFA-related protein|nr:VWA domain-containing protein [Thermoanaerobaculia bacterium]